MLQRKLEADWKVFVWGYLQGTHSPLTILLHWDKAEVGKTLVTEATAAGTQGKNNASKELKCPLDTPAPE